MKVFPNSDVCPYACWLSSWFDVLSKGFLSRYRRWNWSSFQEEDEEEEDEEGDVELAPFHITQCPALTESCTSSNIGKGVDSFLMRTKRLFCFMRATWLEPSRPDPRQPSEEVGTRIPVRLCSVHSDRTSAPSAVAANRSSGYWFHCFKSVFITLHLTCVLVPLNTPQS